MSRLLKFLIMLAVVTAQGPAFAAAICQHQDLTQHIHARQSLDRSIAADAISEEKAAEIATKKGQLAAAANLVLSDMLSPAPFVQPQPAAEPLSHIRADGPALAGRALSPPLQPPTA